MKKKYLTTNIVEMLIGVEGLRGRFYSTAQLLIFSTLFVLAFDASAQNVHVTNPTSRPVPVNIVSGGTGGGPATVADGADVTQGAKADAKSTATDTTPISAISILKQISASAQAPPSQAVTNAGTFAVQSALKQYAGVPSTFTIGTTDATVFTLAAGEIGFIQNLDDAALAVKKGASASTSSLNFILAAGTAADDGKGGAVRIDDWVGVVSVAAMTGSPRYIAWKQAP